MKEIMREQKIIKDEGNSNLFSVFMVPEHRVSIQKDIKSSFGYDVSKEHSYYLQLAMIYIFTKNMFEKHPTRKNKVEVLEHLITPFLDEGFEAEEKKPKKTFKKSKRAKNKAKIQSTQSEDVKPEAKSVIQEDKTSVKMNKFNKRFKKTKKPGKV
jgi:hypothetical protein